MIKKIALTERVVSIHALSYLSTNGIIDHEYLELGVNIFRKKENSLKFFGDPSGSFVRCDHSRISPIQMDGDGECVVRELNHPIKGQEVKITAERSRQEGGFYFVKLTTGRESFVIFNIDDRIRFSTFCKKSILCIEEYFGRRFDSLLKK